MTNHTRSVSEESAFRTLMRGLVATGVALAIVNVAIVCLRANVL